MRLSAPWLSALETQAVFAALDAGRFDAFFVGGCVRNALMDLQVSDIDIATNARPSDVLDCAKAAGLKAIPTGIEHGTVTVVSGGVAHEITTFRADIDTDGRHAKVQFSDDITEDAKRRDFTMNAIYARGDGVVVDPLDGLGDVKAHRIRFIGDPVQRIREDYLRSLRFFRFFAWYGDQDEGLDPEDMAAIAQHLDGLERLSGERVGSEIIKLLSAPRPEQAVAGLFHSGVLARLWSGADIAALGPLIHLEGALDVSCDPMARLAALGGEDVAVRLRLSNADAKRRELLRSEAQDGKTPAHLGYLHGRDVALRICALRAALLDMPLPQDVRADAEFGSNAKFPVSAQDLMPVFQGRALGEKLHELEACWIASRFALGKDDLLG